MEGDGCSGFARLEKGEKGLKMTLQMKKSGAWESAEAFLLSSAMPNVVCKAADIKGDFRETKIEETIPMDTLEKEGLSNMVFDSLCVAKGQEIYCFGTEKEWEVKRAFQSYLETKTPPQKVPEEMPKPREEVPAKGPQECPIVPRTNEVAQGSVNETEKDTGAKEGSIPKPKEPALEWRTQYGIRYQCPFGTCLSGNCSEESNRKIVAFMASLNNTLTLSCLKSHGYYLIGRDERYFYIALPAVYGAEPPYFYRICQSAQWIPAEHEGCHEDALGYWVVKMELSSGEII